jgi:beta-ureidopropionase
MVPRDKFRLGLIQAVPTRWDIEMNWELFMHLAAQAVEGGAKLICTPECFLDGYAASDLEEWSESRFRKVAVDQQENSYLHQVQKWAYKQHVYVLFGYTEWLDQRFYNTAALINSRGEILGKYYKTHLMDHDKRFTPGESITVCETPLGKIGILICADRRFPEAARTLALQGAELLVIPSYGMWHTQNEWWMCTRSYENECPLAFIHPNVTFVTDCQGTIQAKLQSNVPDVLLYDIQLGTHKPTMINHRRSDLYQLS